MRESLFVKSCFAVMITAITCFSLIFSSTMAQAQTGCTYTINPSPLTLPHHLPYTRGFSITTNKSDCSWTVEETSDWISMAPSSKTSGIGSGYFTLMFRQNPSSTSRTAQVIAGGKSVSITQPGLNAGCTYTINPSPLTLPHHLPYTRGFSITTNKSDCSWTVEETSDWISMAPSSKTSGIGSGYFTLMFRQNPSSTSRTAQVIAGGKSVSITQPGLKQTGTGSSYSTSTGSSSSGSGSSSKSCTGRNCTKGNYKIQ